MSYKDKFLKPARGVTSYNDNQVAGFTPHQHEALLEIVQRRGGTIDHWFGKESDYIDVYMTPSHRMREMPDFKFSRYGSTYALTGFALGNNMVENCNFQGLLEFFSRILQMRNFSAQPRLTEI